MRCPNCGAESDKEICEYCGSVLEKPKTAPPPAEQPIPPVSSVPPMPSGQFTAPMSRQPAKQGSGCVAVFAVVFIVVVVLIIVSFMFTFFQTRRVLEGWNEGSDILWEEDWEENWEDELGTSAEDPLYIYKAGMYKVGTDIPAGLYVLQATDHATAHYTITKDSTGEIDSIVANDSFPVNAYVEVEEGQYLEVKRARFAPESDVPAFTDTDGIYGEGMYKVGKDLPAGEYKVRAVEGKTAYVAVLSHCNGGLGSVVTNDNFTDEKYVTVKEGQYIVINRGELVK